MTFFACDKVVIYTMPFNTFINRISTNLSTFQFATEPQELKYMTCLTFCQKKLMQRDRKREQNFLMFFLLSLHFSFLSLGIISMQHLEKIENKTTNVLYSTKLTIPLLLPPQSTIYKKICQSVFNAKCIFQQCREN